MANILAVAGPGSKYNIAGANRAGFWAGLWHGLIAPIAFLVSLFTGNVRIYEATNTGRWYDLGFLIGASISFGGGGSRVVYYQVPGGTSAIT
jgi:hypothetical protein